MNRILFILFVFFCFNAVSHNIDSLELVVSNSKNSPESIKNAADLLNNIYRLKKNDKKTFEYYEIYILMRDSIAAMELKKAAIKDQLKHEFEKKELQDSVKNAEHILHATIKHQVSIKQQRFYTYGGIAGFALMLVIAGISFRAFRNKKKANKIISEQKKIVDEQKHKVDEKQKEILDSIRYAKRIQTALITSEHYIDKTLNRLV